mgnify:CR=1 FL=1
MGGQNCQFAVRFLSDRTGECIRARIWLITVFLCVKNHHFCEIKLSNLAQMFRVQGTTMFVD